MRVDRVQPDLPQKEGAVQRENAGQQKNVQKSGAPPSPLKKRIIQEEQAIKEGSLHDLTERVEQLNETLRVFDKRLHFDIHEDTNRVMVQVIDIETDEVLREIPPERILDMVASIEEALGLIIDERI